MEYGKKDLTPEEKLMEHKIRVRLGEYLKQLRKKKNLTTRGVGELLGISSNYVSEIERGMKSPSDKLLRELANLYGVDEDELFALAERVSLRVQEFIMQEKDFQLLIGDIAKANLDPNKKQLLLERFRRAFEEIKNNG